MNQKTAITIDGPAGAGKSTAARLLARKLGYIYVDSGAMYRAIAWLYLQRGVASLSLVNDHIEEKILSDVSDKTKFQIRNDPEGRMKIIIENVDITSLIRKIEVERLVAHVAQRKKVRFQIIALLRDLARDDNLVIEGRDIGTVVFPEAQIKFFMVASPIARAQRRYLELREKNTFKLLSECLRDLEIRDQMDMNREVAPLRPAADAIVIDTTKLTILEVVDFMLKHFGSKYSETARSIKDELADLIIKQPCSLIAISGPIGVGKTTLCLWLSEKLKIPVFRENPDENPFLRQYYSNPESWAFPSQMWFLWRKYELLSSIKQQGTAAIIDRTLHEDYIFAKVLLQENQLTLYEQWYRMVFSMAPEPDLIISLEASVSSLYKRTRDRGRDYELNISIDFLEALQKEYVDWISNYSDCPKIRINTELQDVRSPQIRAEISALIDNLLQSKEQT